LRRFVQSLAVLSVTPVALALPVVSRPLTAPRPVAPKVSEHAVRGVDAASARSIPGFGVTYGPAASRPLALTAPVRTGTFSALGVTWDAGSGDEADVVARVRQDGAWSPWHVLDADPDHEPDKGSVDTASALRAGTAPWFHGPADGYQVRVGVVDGVAPANVRVSLVDPGTSPADASIGRSPTLGSDEAAASIGQPSFVSRAQWGADESLRDGSPDYGDTIKMGFVHHTDNSNSYSMAGAAALVRSVYAFHTQSRGWSDIGYNFLVDKYGRIFEGRYGGVARPVIGAHTGGFNTDTFGAALLGNYTSVAPSSAQLGALQRLFAWKLGLHYVNPVGRTTMTSRGGTKYAEGEKVTLNNVSGHRDAGLTSCPGQATYSRLPAIRSAIKSAMGASLYYPSATTSSAMYLTTPSVAVKAGTPVAQAWRLDVRNARSGAIVRQVSGSGSASAITATWNLKDKAGNLVPPDTYTLTLSSWTTRTRAKPYTVRVKVASPLPDGASIRYSTQATNVFVENGGLGAVSQALASALRPTPPLVSFPGQRATMKGVSAPPRDGLFVKAAATGALYLVVDGHRRPVSSSTVSALGLTAPVTLPSTVVAGAPSGPAWTDTARHPDGMVVRGTDGAAWRIESGVRRPFTSPASRARWSKGFAAPMALPGDLALPLGAPLAPPEGTVLRHASSAGVVSDGAFRMLTDGGALGYAVNTAPIATAEDLAALVAGPPVGAERHPSGTLLRNGASYLEVLGTTKRTVPASLVPTDPRTPVAALTGEVSSLLAPRWLPGSGIAGRGADGTVRVVDNGRLVTVAPDVAASLYGGVTLPALEAADFGPLPPASALANAALHPAGSLVTDGTGVWLVDAGTRRPVAASLRKTYRGRPALPATAADLALPVGTAASVPTGAYVVTPDNVRWLVARGVRRSVTATVARRLSLSHVTPQPVVTGELNAVTSYGGVLK
jgi:hypothetical protein